MRIERVNLIVTPNQRFEFDATEQLYTIALHQVTDTSLLASLRVYDVNSLQTFDVMKGFVVTSDMPLIPYRYINAGYGNFIFVTPNDEIPHYSKFGTSHNLYYYER